MNNSMKNESTKIEIQSNIDLVKKVRSKLNLHIYIYNIVVIIVTLMSAIVTLASAFYSDKITEYLHIDKYIQPKALSVTLIIFTILLIVNTYDKEKDMQNIERFSNILQFDQDIPDDSTMLQKELDRIYYFIKPFAAINDLDDSSIHINAMKFRKKIFGAVLIIGTIIFGMGIYKKLSLPLIVFMIGLIIYPFVILEYWYHVYLRKKKYSDWYKKLFGGIINEKEYIEKTKGTLSKGCKLMILAQALQRLQYRYLVWTKSTLALSILALIFSILQFTNNVDGFITFLKLPFNNLQLISTVFLFMSSIISVLQMILDKELITRISKISRCFNNLKCNYDIIGYNKLRESGIINELDIARGKYEYTIRMLEKEDALDLADVFGKENEKRTALSRINGLLIYLIFESGTYCLWYKNGDFLAFLIACIGSLCLYFFIILCSNSFKDKQYQNIIRQNMTSK